jgi:pimeloyl-ACP methyl ester carboxylesterase
MQTSVTNWLWKGDSIAYRHLDRSPGDRPPMVLIHGFGASLGHWRKNLPALAEQHAVYALDLIGFGASAKPRNVAYTFETWGEQVKAFVREVVGQPTLLVGNSIGAIVALQSAALAPEAVRGVALLNCSLRLLHVRKRSTIPWIRRASAPLLQKLLALPGVGTFFFDQVRKPGTVRKILKQAYIRQEAVTDELVEILCRPAADPGAAEVFLAFTRYDTGPLAEDLLPLMKCPVTILWGVQDPWEPFALGQGLAAYPCVQDFVPIDRAGHCPQDEAPEEVNRVLLNWGKQF